MNTKGLSTLTLCSVASILIPHLSEAARATLKIDVLDTLILNEPLIDHLKIIELSGLAYNQPSGALFAISDKGRLFSFDLDVTGNQITALEPMTGHNLVDARGTKIRNSGFNAEGMDLGTSGTLTIVSEDGPRIASFSSTGEWIEDLGVPSALSDPAAQRSAKDGLESLARHPDLGLLTAPEEPLAAQPRTTHTIYSTTGGTFVYNTSDIGITSIKAMETLPDGRLMILERNASDTDGSLIPWLRILDPAACALATPCSTQAARIEVPDISDADFEGLTHFADDLFLIVSDDKIGKDHRSVFGLLRVTSAPTATSDHVEPK